MSEIAKKDNGFKIAEKWATIGIFGNLFLSVLKFAAGILGNSSAMIADAIHSASDVFASFFVYIGLRIAKKPADENHPYGHHKAEVITTMIVGLMLMIAGYEIIKTALNVIKIGNLEIPKSIALYAAVLSIATKEIMYRYTYAAGVKINSPSTIANAKDHRSDAFSSVATLIGIGGAKLGFPIFDPVAGIIVSLFIFKMGYEIIAEAVKQIMDENVDVDMLIRVADIALNVDGVMETHDIRIRQSGSVYLVDMDIVVESNITIAEAHDICEVVRYKIFDDIDNVNEVRVHIDPLKG